MIQPVTIRSLLDAAVHFGHQTRRWNPKMKPYIFGERNGVYILDLKQTMIGLDQAYTFVQQIALFGGTVLFVGTKKQAQEPVAANAQRCGMPYVNHRWLGGMLTNFVTIRSRVTHMEELEAMEADGQMSALPKKEQIHLRKELGKLQANLDGIREMKTVPQVIFVVDTMRENIAIREARRLGIPVVGIIDTNSDPDDVDYGIPGNDDAIRSVNLITEVIAEAVLSGLNRGAVSEEDILAGQNAAETASDLALGSAAAEEGFGTSATLPSDQPVSPYGADQVGLAAAEADREATASSAESTASATVSEGLSSAVEVSVPAAKTPALETPAPAASVVATETAAVDAPAVEASIAVQEQSTADELQSSSQTAAPFAEALSVDPSIESSTSDSSPAEA